MASVRNEAACRNRERAGFTVIEALIVLLIVATVVGALTPSMARTISRARVNRSANILAADLLQAQTLAGRARSPVVLTFDGSAMTLTVALPPPASTVLATHRFGPTSDLKLTTFSSDQPTLQVLPNSMASVSVTVTLGAAGYSRQVHMTRAGLVRVR